MSEDLPFRLRTLKALTMLLQTITPAKNCNVDLSGEGQVVRGRLLFGDSEPLPLVSILEPPLAIEPIPSSPTNPHSKGDWDLLIQGWVKDDKDNPTDPAYMLAAEVRKILALERLKADVPDILGMGSAIMSMKLGAPVVRPSDETSAKACFYLLVTLEITEDMTKPFS